MDNTQVSPMSVDPIADDHLITHSFHQIESETVKLEENADEKTFPFDHSQSPLNAQLYYIQENIAKLQDKISQIGYFYLSLEEKLEALSQKHEKKLTTLETATKKNTDAVKEKFESIETKINSIETSYRREIKEKIKKFFRPRIGTLYQYDPRPFHIPKHYFNTKPLTKTPTISIVTPSFNQSQFLERTILSVISQKYPQLEYMIQDGGSTDDSAQVMEHYSPFLKHWESIKDNGQSHALNLGFRHATGDIMAYLNSDDILLPGTLNYVAHFFNEHPDVDVIYGHRVLINENDHEIGRWVLPPHDSAVLTWADFVPQETLFWRKRIWDKVGGKIDEKFLFAMDWDLLLRFADAGAKFERLPRFLGAFRVHVNQKTSAQISKTGIAEMERLRVRHHGRLVTPGEISKNIRRYLIKHIIYNKLYRLNLLRY